ncbi:MAG: outer membrane lipoprotein chaperone LolA [Xanthomonadaceae bacterium]|nr:outer membrane lipoprotein chaperone LolA [Xanthomonadaceae bacterium]MDE1959297.1 outer membrane lipoprotein chaperone LolA [Xanthomonadaceae bacterium]MDE2178882.1 outer membrane lipoprotein chaperone LolA [Xanthomonadaceae bacterium]MDE2245639.1 outer membrane lipoprotein chaperone LolA [Xanthomonadaceae bacterium]
MRVALLLLAALLLAPVVHADDSARARLDAFAHDLKSISGDFTQTTVDANGRKAQTAQGTLALQAPRLFRWQVSSPYRQLIVADGKRVWLYDPELQQVTVHAQGAAEAHSPLTVLTDIGELDRRFKVTELGTRDGLAWLKLTPTAANPDFKAAELGFGPQGLARMVFTDQLDNRTEIAFSGWRRNIALPAGEFRFTPPPGADVIGDAVPAAEVYPLKN